MRLRFSPWIISPAANLFIGLMGVGTSILTARVMGPADRGVLATAMIWPGLVMSLGAIVNTQSVACFWAKSKADGTYAAVWTASLIEQKYQRQPIARQMADVYKWVIEGGGVPSCVSVD